MISRGYGVTSTAVCLSLSSILLLGNAPLLVSRDVKPTETVGFLV